MKFFRSILVSIIIFGTLLQPTASWATHSREYAEARLCEQSAYAENIEVADKFACLYYLDQHPENAWASMERISLVPPTFDQAASCFQARFYPGDPIAFRSQAYCAVWIGHEGIMRKILSDTPISYNEWGRCVPLLQRRPVANEWDQYWNCKVAEYHRSKIDVDLTLEQIYINREQHRLEVEIVNEGMTSAALYPEFAVTGSWEWLPQRIDENGLPPILPFTTQEKIVVNPVRWRVHIPYGENNVFPPNGSLGFTVQIDTDNIIRERNENNNRFTIQSHSPLFVEGAAPPIESEDVHISDLQIAVDLQNLFGFDVSSSARIDSDIPQRELPDFRIWNFQYQRLDNRSEQISFNALNQAEGTHPEGSPSPLGSVLYLEQDEFPSDEVVAEATMVRVGEDEWTLGSYPFQRPLPEHVVGIQVSVNRDRAIRESNYDVNHHFHYFEPDLELESALVLDHVQNIGILNRNHETAPTQGAENNFLVRFSWTNGERYLYGGDIEATPNPDNPGQWNAIAYIPRPEGATHYVIEIDPTNVVYEAFEAWNNRVQNAAPGVSMHEMAEFDRRAYEDNDSEYEPRFLPDSPWYVLKNFARGTRLALTFSDEREFSLRTKYLEQMAVEYEKMGNKESDAAKKHIGKILSAGEKLEGLSAADTSDMATLLRVYAALETKVDEDTQTKVEEQMKDIFAWTPDEKVNIVFQEAFAGKNTSIFAPLYEIELLKRLENSADEKSREKIQQVREIRERFLDERIENLNATEQKNLPDYAGAIASDEVRQLEVLRSVASKVENPRAREAVETAAARIAGKIEARAQKSEEYRAKVLRDIANEEGTDKIDLETLVILNRLKSFENNKDLDAVIARRKAALEAAKQAKTEDPVISAEVIATTTVTPTITTSSPAVATSSRTQVVTPPVEVRPIVRPVQPVVTPPRETPTEPQPVVNERPILLCSNQYIPVCGSDGKNYDNSCYAKQAGVKVVFEGRCEDRCVPKQSTVCGRDGKTYDNECEAQDAGTRVDHLGQCTPDPVIIIVNPPQITPIEPIVITPEPPRSNAPGNVTILIGRNGFEYSSRNVRPGGYISFTNLGNGEPHAIVGDLSTRVLELGQSANLTAPTTPGTYSFYLSDNMSITGSITVE